MALFQALRARVRRHWAYVQKKHGLTVEHLDDIGAHENPGGRRNTHWGVAVAAEFVREFEITVRQRLSKLTGIKDLGAALHFAPIYAGGGYAKYILKGIDPSYQRYFFIEAEDQGFIAGRGRTFVARSISQAARRQAGWSRKSRAGVHHSQGAKPSGFEPPALP